MALCEACGKPRPPAAVAFCSPTCYHAHHRSRTAEERFWSHVERGEGCWEWRGAKGHTKAPTFGADPYKPMSAVRYSWELHNGPIPKGLLVCHRCDNPPCVRPDHLFLGTHAENTRDMYVKGRNFDLGAWVRAHPERSGRKPLPGESNPAAKLTEADVAAIRGSWPADSQNILARRFGVTQATIWRVVHHKTW